MGDAPESTGGPSRPPRWVLLLYTIPAKPAYFRVRVSRRLERIGAAMLKGSTYALPFDDESVEHFQWLRTEIEANEGTASLAFVTHLDEQTERDLCSKLGVPWEDPLAQSADPSGRAALSPGERLEGRTWVTRRGVAYDRIASAWLIRSRIDPEASFKFVSDTGYVPEPGELRFDMFDGEFSHVGDRCTFEVLLDFVDDVDEALRTVGEIVHDIDLRDDRYAHPETAGFRAMIEGIAESTDDDMERLRLGAVVLDGLHRGVGRA